MSDMFSTQETELREGTLVGLGDIGIEIEDLDEEEIDDIIPKENRFTTLSLQNLQFSEQNGSAKFALLFGRDASCSNEAKEITIVQDIVYTLNS